MRISIALCTFNGAHHLRQQLDSLLAQTRLPDEVVVGDDVSEDETPAILADFAARAPFPVRIERNDRRLGPTGNFGETIARCTGDVILPCDQDDVWLPTKVQRQVEPFERSPAVDFSIVQSEIVNDDLTPRRPMRTVFDDQRFGLRLRRDVRRGEGFRSFLRHPVAPGHASAFSARLRSVLLPFPETCVFDQWIALVGSAVGQTAFVRDALVKYRRHRAQAVGADKSLADWAASRPKLDHLQRQIDTLTELDVRVGPAMPAGRRRRLAGRLAFLEMRHAMRASRVARTGLSLRLLATGSYHRHGRGFLAFARDLRG